jgi:hypothetical protein
LYDLKRQIRPVGVAYRELITANQGMPAVPALAAEIKREA